jgi:hypothetical protein
VIRNLRNLNILALTYVGGAWRMMDTIMKQISKKKLRQKKRSGEEAHYEGKYFCDCRIRNYRKWLGKKLYGYLDEMSNLVYGY